MHKIILHCHDADNLAFMARTAKHCMEADMPEGDSKVLLYGEGQLPQPVTICAIRRKSCITIYDQPGAPTPIASGRKDNV